MAGSYDMKPYEHIQRACELLDQIDRRPDDLKVADLHLQIAHMKMMGGQRA